jgi:hypothetical protein
LVLLLCILGLGFILSCSIPPKHAMEWVQCIVLVCVKRAM